MHIEHVEIPFFSKASTPATLYTYDGSDIAAITPSFDWVANTLHNFAPSSAVMGAEIFGPSIARRKLPLQFREYLKGYIAGHRENARLDYKDPLTFLAFDTVYFYRNLLKCLLAAHHIRSIWPNSADLPVINDIGCGVGTFSIACKLMTTFPTATFNLIDQSHYQLFLAEQLAKKLGYSEYFRFEKSNVLSRFEHRGVAIASYWLCGNKDDVLLKQDDYLKGILRDGLVMVDYSRNVFQFMRRVKDLGHRMQYQELKAPVLPHLVPLIGSRDLNTHLLIIDPIIQNNLDRPV